jgi:hypothetical protein
MRSAASWLRARVTWVYRSVWLSWELPEDLLDDSDADALVKKERRGGVPRVVHPGLAKPCLLQQGPPVRPVFSRVDRRARGLADDQVPVRPRGSGGETLGGLLATVSLALVDERDGERPDELGLALTRLDA